MKSLSLHSGGMQLKAGKISDDKVLLAWILGLILLRLWLVEEFELMVTWSPHDDYLFVSLAKHLLSGEWLGPYSEVTLIKGPVFPLFIAASHLAGIPLFLSLQLLYSSACAIAISALRPLCANRFFLLACFTLLLLNPFLYNFPGVPGRVFREGFSISLVLIVFATLLGTITRLKLSLKSAISWSLGFGIAFTLLWHTREEGLWLLPSVALSALLLLLVDRASLNIAAYKRMLLLFIPSAIFCVFSLLLAFLNYKHYGEFIINELKTKEFTAAYGGLMNIKPKIFIQYAPVSKDVMEQAFAVSATFNELKPYFDKHELGAQLPPAFYIWSLRSIVREASDTKNLTDTLQFYSRIGSELEQACKDGRLDCLDRTPSLQPPWNSSYNKLVLPVFGDIFQQAVGFTNFHADLKKFEKTKSFGKKKLVDDFRFVTLEHILPADRKTVAEYPEYYQHIRIEKIRVLNDIGNSYKFIVPVLFAISFLIHLFMLFSNIRQRRFSMETVFGAVLLGGLVSLFAILSFVKITLWPIDRPLYSAYPVVLLYICFMLVTFARSRLSKET